jgi:hypothetical protein
MTIRLIASFTALMVAAVSQGCATTKAPATTAAGAPMVQAALRLATCTGPQCASQAMQIAQHTQVPVENNAPEVKGHPLTSVVVTQCDLIVAVYMTMPDGRLLRFDHTAAVPAEQLMQMAYAATRSERVEVSCNDAGAVGFERHDPV